jgi:hypothetical protein
MVSIVTMIPELKLGVIVLTNQESGAAFQSIANTVLDHYLEAPPKDWVTAYATLTKRQKEEADKTVSGATSKRAGDSKPSLALDAYAGRYRDPWYGDVVIEKQGSGLGMRFTHTHALTGKLEPWQYDTFVVRWNDRSLDADAYVTFSLKPDGSIDQLKMKAVSPTTDFSFDFHDLVLKPVAKDAPAY